MTSVGETLRRERLRRNLDLDQISRELKISPKLLQAIEAEEFSKLPGTVFARNFVRQYAQLLGLDEQEMAAEVQRHLQPQTEAPRLSQTARPPTVPIQVPKVEQWEMVSDRGFSWGSPLPALALFVLAMLACSGVYAWYQRAHRPMLAQNSTAVQHPAAAAQPAALVTPAVTPAVTPTVTPAVQPPAQTPQAQQPEPQAPPAQSSLASAAKAAPEPVKTVAQEPDPNATVHVQITAGEASWVLARGDGKYLFSGTLEPNQTRTVEAVNNIELRLGNAGGVTVTLNGKPLGEVGPKGQVRTIQLTSGGFHIVAAPKSPPPLIDPL